MEELFEHLVEKIIAESQNRIRFPALRRLRS